MVGAGITGTGGVLPGAIVPDAAAAAAAAATACNSFPITTPYNYVFFDA
jgi:hypothetical protein